jgi:hypothetical protein
LTRIDVRQFIERLIEHGNTSVIEKGPGRAPNSASWRSGSSEASSSSVGCSGSPAYGQKRSSGLYLGGSEVMLGTVSEAWQLVA